MTITFSWLTIVAVLAWLLGGDAVNLQGWLDGLLG